jgi:hypothetical protein
MRIFQNKFNLRQYLRKRYKRRNIEIAPEDILIDSSNIPEYDTSQLEGRLEKPISRFSLYSVIGFFMMYL